MKRFDKPWALAVIMTAALASLLAPRAAAQDGAISGQILDVEGKPWVGLGVQAVSDQGAKQETKTDSNGKYAFRNLKSGVFTVNVVLPNQAQPYQAQARVQGGQETTLNINFKDVVEKARQSSKEFAEAEKKQQEEKQKFAGMKAHFDAGTALLEKEKVAKADLQKATPDQREAAKQNLKDLSDQAAKEFQDAQKSAGEKDTNLHLVWAKLGEGLALPAEDGPGAAIWQQLLRWSGNKSRADLFVDIGVGRKIATIVATRLARLLAEGGVRADALALTMGRYAAVDDSVPSQGLVLIDGSEGASVRMAPCCRPIPGDAIVGYLGRGEGLVVHTAECGVGKRLYERDSERWMAVDWAEQPTRAFETGITLLLKNGKGVLAEVAAAVAAAEADITHIDMGDEPASESTELRLLLSVRDRLHLAEVIRTLKRSAAVLRVARIKP